MGTISTHSHPVNNGYVTNNQMTGTWQVSQSWTTQICEKDKVKFQKGHGAAEKGDMYMDLEAGCLYAYTGTEWVPLTDGVKEKTQVEKIVDELRETYPEALFDLIMKGII